MNEIKYFKFWCQKVLPLVYDNSLSYYEVLCKVVKYINDLIASDKEIIDNIDELREELNVVQKWINDFDYEPLLEMVKEMVNKYIVAGIYVELSDDGYIVFNIPESWNAITFRTTGYDYSDSESHDFGHLVLLY